MKKIVPLVEKSKAFSDFLKAWETGVSLQLDRTPGSSPLFILAQAYHRHPRPFVVIGSDEKRTDVLRSELEGFLAAAIDLYPGLEVSTEDGIPPEPGLWGERYRILAALRRDTAVKPLLVTTLAALKQKVPSPDHLERATLKLKQKGKGDPDSIVRRLVARGYENHSPVLQKGQFDRRGGIVDAYPGHLDHPVRIEFYEDTIAFLRSFDPRSQRSTTPISEVEIYPAQQAGPGEGGLVDHLPTGYRLIWLGPFPPEETAAVLPPPAALPSFFFDLYPVTSFGSGSLTKLSFLIGTLEKFKYRRPGPSYPLLDATPQWLRAGYRVIIYAHNVGESQRLNEILAERKISPHPHLRMELGEVSRGFIWEEARLVVVGDSEIFSRYQIPRPRLKYHGKAPFLQPAEFHAGDYVVHLDHGIGRYLGVKRLETAGERREMLAIQYSEQARLYVPPTQAHLISRYMGVGKKRPALDSLGGSRWLRAKVAAQRSVQDLASELLEVQARRETLTGHSFSPDTPWQRELEAAFIYPETPDQSVAMAEIKKDMESPGPMDRLLCGDAGYGKTEVAIRAAFKAVLDGKQVAVLVPTTVLAQQHFQTFRERLSDYPVRVEMLSRFLTAARQKAVLDALAKGPVDIVIGTHRLLQSDVVFKDLGLVVIDEEQRFGVRHKERFKQMRKLVDVLTLTATPIPRTLYLALSGTRDLSAIDTPPQDRLAVETFVLPYDPDEVKAAVRRETGRGGQVYYVHNRVKDIEQVGKKLRDWFPGLTVTVAHGQMEGKELARVMENFARGEIDLLVCTTIIESGLDIPNANTIIVENSERFGLSDLYQLRGRVGRFKRRAYSYFFFPPSTFLEEGPRKRLRAIEEFSHLGAGFNLALRDLEIRGAGNILGREQHGHITAVGFDLYCRLLKESIKRLRGEKVKKPPPVKMEFDLPGNLPSDYIKDEKQRIEMYRKWAFLADREELAGWERESRDRFGPLPEEVKVMSTMARLKLEAGEMGVTSIGKSGGNFVFRRGKRIILVTTDLLPGSLEGLLK